MFGFLYHIDILLYETSPSFYFNNFNIHSVVAKLNLA